MRDCSAPPSSRLRVGIIGLSASGGFAADAHLPALRALADFDVVALSASTPERSRLAARKFGIATFGSAYELATSDSVDVVVVSVRVPDHFRAIRPAIEAGKIVYAEWPLATDLAEARTLAADASERGVRTAVGLQARSSPSIRYVRDLVADGYVGEVLSTTVVGSGVSWGATVRATNRYTIRAENGATIVSIPMAHGLDAVGFVLGELSSLRATTATRRATVIDDLGEAHLCTSPDNAAATGLLANGGLAAIHYRGGRSRGTNFLWEINGTDGDIVISASSGHLQLEDLNIRGARGTGDLTELEIPSRYHLVPSLVGNNARVVNVANAYAGLLRDIRNGTAVIPDFDHAVRRHRTISDIEHSAATPFRGQSQA